MKEPLSFIKKQEKIAKLNVGSRIVVWWPKEKDYYAGTIVEIRSSNKKKPHHIQYDDGDSDWEDLQYRKFKNVPPKADRLMVGSRVSVWNAREHKYFVGTVTKLQPERTKPHRVTYDDRPREWVNLFVQEFIDIDSTTTDHSQSTTKRTPIKRKREFMEHRETSSTVPKKRTKAASLIVEDTGNACQETCNLCKAPARRPRATSCHHIFCKRCISDYCGSDEERTETCPVCNIRILPELVKFKADHASFMAVEALEMTTAEVTHVFSSSSAASLELGVVPSRIIEACKSKRRDDRECRGFYWRFKGSKDRILRVGEGVKDGLPIEQVSLETGEIIAKFPSSRKASEKTGVVRTTIRRVLQRKGKANGGGFFWRFEGETHEPWPDPEPTNLNSVEKLDFETGDFLESFLSLADAKRKMGMKMNSQCIRDVCDGKGSDGKGRATAKGFFWRWKGSKALPDHMMSVEKIVQIKKTKNGAVIKEFRTSREAQSYVGYQCCWSTICGYCREGGFGHGYFWKYRMLTKPKSASEAVVGKRLRILQRDANNQWLEGKVTAFDAANGLHEISFDRGTIEHHNLEAIQYEWKNDQGQKPVEKLDRKTGEVLASFKSVTDAGKVVGATRISAIVGVCNGRVRSSAGFFWRYEGSDALPPKPKVTRRIEQLCLETGRVLATFDSIVAAGKAVGITTPGISYCCNGRNGSKSAGGFGWRFNTEETESTA